MKEARCQLAPSALTEAETIVGAREWLRCRIVTIVICHQASGITFLNMLRIFIDKHSTTLMRRMRMKRIGKDVPT